VPGQSGFKLLLELIELELNLFGRPALLVDGDDALFKVHARLDSTDNLIAGSEHPVKQLELFREQLVDTDIGGVRFVKEVDDNHVVLSDRSDGICRCVVRYAEGSKAYRS